MATMRYASIIDYPKEELCSEIWDISEDPPKLQNDIREEIIDIVYSALDDVGIPDTAVQDIFIYGSLLGNQYNKGTDLDARIVLAPDRLPDRFKDISGDQLYELLRDLIHDIQLGDTAHPFNATIVVEGDESELDKSPLGKTEEDPVYNVTADAWVVEPFLRDDDFDPDEEFSEERDEVDEVMERLDVIFRETKTDIIDYSLIEDAISGVKYKDKFKKKLDEKLEEIERNLEKAVDEYERIKKERSDAYGEGERHKDPKNVEMKYLERYNYWDMLKQVKHILEGGVEDQEVEILEETVASKLKLATEYLGAFSKKAAQTWDQIVEEELEKIVREKGVSLPPEAKKEILNEVEKTLFTRGSDTPEDLNKAISVPEGPSMFGTTDDYVRDIVHAEADYYIDELLDIDASLHFWAQFSPAETLNFWDLGMNRGQVAQMLGQVPLRGTYRITDDQIMFDNPRDAQAVWEYFTMNM